MMKFFAVLSLSTLCALCFNRSAAATWITTWEADPIDKVYVGTATGTDIVPVGGTQVGDVDGQSSSTGTNYPGASGIWGGKATQTLRFRMLWHWVQGSGEPALPPSNPWKCRYNFGANLGGQGPSWTASAWYGPSADPAMAFTSKRYSVGYPSPVVEGTPSQFEPLNWVTINGTNYLTTDWVYASVTADAHYPNSTAISQISVGFDGPEDAS